MMKKVKLFAAVLGVSVLAGGATAYTINKAFKNKTDVVYSGFSSGGIGTQFTSYEKESYPDLTYAAENAVKGVVNIEIIKEVASSGGGFNPFEEFFGFGFGRGSQQAPPREQRGGGSGVIISPDGYIVTNNHVVEDAKEVKVTLNDRRSFTAKVIGTDPTTDVALIKIDATDLPTIPFGNSDDLRLGEWVLAIGSPYGLQNTITAGIISAKARRLDAIPNDFRLEAFIQTDAAVNPGNSGGALVNTAGQLVGINTLISSQTGSYIGYSFAVPSSLVQKVVVDLKEYGVIQRALLGIMMQEVVDGKIYDKEGKPQEIKEKSGLYVVEVTEGGAAEAAGIKKGDVIVGIDGMDITSSARLQEEIGKRRPNDKVKVSIKRDGELKQIDVVLRNQSGSTDIVKKDWVSANDALGGTFSDISDKAKKELKISGGVMVTSVNGKGILAQARVSRGFIITQINDRKINSVSDLARVTEKIKYIDGITPDGRGHSYVIE